MMEACFLSVRDAAARLSIGVSTMNKLRTYGGGPEFHRIGRRVVYSTKSLDKWVAQRTFETTSQYSRQN
jgi:predicted DNA-binding transcriptional regulator AlpA